MWRFPRHKKLCLGRRQFERPGIRDQHVRPELKKFAQALGCVAGFANHGNVRLILQQTSQALPQQNMVVHEQTADLPAGESYSPKICAWGHTVPPLSSQ